MHVAARPRFAKMPRVSSPVQKPSEGSYGPRNGHTPARTLDWHSRHARPERTLLRGNCLHVNGRPMPEPTYSRQNESDATKASARLPGLDIDIIHRQSPGGDWEQMSINLRATPSFDALGRSFEPADPFTLWARAVRLMWMPWLLTAHMMMLPGRPAANAPEGRQLSAIDTND
jgi:hypothetical protein